MKLKAQDPAWRSPESPAAENFEGVFQMTAAPLTHHQHHFLNCLIASRGLRSSDSDALQPSPQSDIRRRSDAVWLVCARRDESEFVAGDVWRTPECVRAADAFFP